MEKEPTMQELFLRALNKIDRRLQSPIYPEYAKEALRDHRKSLVEQIPPPRPAADFFREDVNKKRRAQFNNLKYYLRNIDRETKRRGMPCAMPRV